MSKNIRFIRVNSKIIGPVNDKQLASLAKRGIITDKNEISSDKINWKPLAELSGFMTFYRQSIGSKEDTASTILLPPDELGLKNPSAAPRHQKVNPSGTVKNLSEYSHKGSSVNAAANNSYGAKENTENLFERAVNNGALQARRKKTGTSVRLLKSKKFWTLAVCGLVFLITLCNWEKLKPLVTDQFEPEGYFHDNILNPGAKEEREKAKQEEGERKRQQETARLKAEQEQKEKEETEAKAKKEQEEAESFAAAEKEKRDAFDHLGYSFKIAAPVQSKYHLADSQMLARFKDDVTVTYIPLLPLDNMLKVKPSEDALLQLWMAADGKAVLAGKLDWSRTGLTFELFEAAEKIAPSAFQTFLFSAIKLSLNNRERYVSLNKPTTYDTAQPECPVPGKTFLLYETPEQKAAIALLSPLRLTITGNSIELTNIPFPKEFSVHDERTSNAECPVTFTDWKDINGEALSGMFMLSVQSDASSALITLIVKRTPAYEDFKKTTERIDEIKNWVSDFCKNRIWSSKINGSKFDEKVSAVNDFYRVRPYKADEKLAGKKIDIDNAWRKEKEDGTEKQWRDTIEEYGLLNQRKMKLQILLNEIDAMEKGPYKPIPFQIAAPLKVNGETPAVPIFAAE